MLGSDYSCYMLHAEDLQAADWCGEDATGQTKEAENKVGVHVHTCIHTHVS